MSMMKYDFDVPVYGVLNGIGAIDEEEMKPFVGKKMKIYPEDTEEEQWGLRRYC